MAFATSLFDADGIQYAPPRLSAHTHADSQSPLPQLQDRGQRPHLGAAGPAARPAGQVLRCADLLISRDAALTAGLTPLGTSLDKKILQPLVLGPARAGRLEKPVVVIVITDGTPAGDQISVQDAILRADAELKRTRWVL